MVPPLVTASRSSRRGPRIVSLTRSHTIRGTQLGELLARVATGEQIEHVAEQLVGQIGEAGAATDERGQVADGDLADGRGVATICWASTSSGLRMYRECSISPSSMRRATTAASTRSPRCLGKIVPLLGSPTECPARPMRCRPRLTAPGDSTWMTRSTAPMSMPSSSDDVATIAFSSPRLSWSSTITRCSRASEPWWACTSSIVGLASVAAPRQQLVEPGSQPLRQPAGVGEDDRRAVLQHEFEHPRVDAGPDARPRRRRPPPGSPSGVAASPGSRHVVDRDDDLDLERLAHAGVDDLHRRGDSPTKPPRNRAISSSGRCVAESPMRCGGLSVTSSSRSSVSARWAPRLVAARAWISSMITASTPLQRLARRRREHQVERLGRGDQEVGRVADELLALVGRRVAGAHRRRSGAVNGTPSRSAARPMPVSGARRFFSTSNARARSGEM